MKKSGGFIQLIVIFALLIVIVSLLGINLQQDVADNPEVQGNFSYVLNTSKWLWNNYLHDPVRIAFQVWVDVLWKPFVSAMRNIGEDRTSTPFTE